MSKLIATFNDLATLAADLDGLRCAGHGPGAEPVRGAALAYLLPSDAAKEINQLRTTAGGRKGDQA